MVSVKNSTFIEKLLPAPVGGGFKMDGYWVWCGSAVIGDDGRYHLFASRWSKKLPMFEGYVLTSEIVRAVSDSPTGPYSFVEKILPSGNAGGWDGRMAHNPSIHYHKGRYYLFYIGSTYAGEVQEDIRSAETARQLDESYANIKIGMVSSASLCGPWEPHDGPVLVARPGKWDGKIVTNPSPCILPDGKTYLYYRSNTPDGLRIGLAVAESPEGPYERIGDGPVLQGLDVEDPFVWFNGESFEMLAKDMTGELSGEKHAGVHLRSADGINWTSCGMGYSRKVIWDDGRVVEQGSLERPKLIFSAEGKPLVLLVAVADGPGGFRNASNTWTAGIPVAIQGGCFPKSGSHS